MPEFFNEWFPSSKHGTDVLNVKSFGCTGDGSTNDGPSLQLALDAIRTPAAGGSGARSLYFPPGNYRTEQVLYLYSTTGACIWGNGPNSTFITYAGPANVGNTLGDDPPTGFNPSEITPVIMADGWSYSSMEDLCLVQSTAGSTMCGMYIYQDPGAARGVTTACYYKGVHFYGLTADGTTKAQTGVIIGYDPLCSEQTFIDCQANQWASYGWSVVAQNALNISLINCGGTDNGIWARCAVGSMYIYGGSVAHNTVDIETGNVPMIISGVRSESKQFVDSSQTQGYLTIIGCTQSSYPDPGFFCNVGSSLVTIQSCFFEAAEISPGLRQIDAARILGGGELYMTGNYLRNGLSHLKDYLGQIREFVQGGYMMTNVADLPTLQLASWKGIRLFVEDATATTFNSIVAGSGANKVPVFCDGTNWRIG